MPPAPLILFGAFDRHNFGDLLFPHLWLALLPGRELVCAGLAECDLSGYGGHRVRALGRLAGEWGERPADLVHVGGELLTCTLYQAAVMTLPPAEAAATIRAYDAEPAAGERWARSLLGLDQAMAYLAAKALFRRPGRFIYHAVGGVDLARLGDGQRSEVLARLGEADHLSVRDRVTQAALREHGMAGELAPDSAHLTAELFGERIREAAQQGEVQTLRQRFAQGYVAVQCSADFGDDATLQIMAAQLDALVQTTGLGIVLFRAGAAPWHDDLEIYRRLAGFMRGAEPALFGSLDLWAICALLAQARAYCGSSLHGRIVADSLVVPAASLVPSITRPSKQAAYLSSWFEADRLNLCEPAGMTAAVQAALQEPAEQREARSKRLAQLARQALERSLAVIRAD